MDKEKVLQSLPKTYLGSSKRQQLIESIKTQIEKGDTIHPKNKKNLKTLRNALKTAYSRVLNKGMTRKRFNNVNRLLTAIGENSNSISEGNTSFNSSSGENSELAAALAASLAPAPAQASARENSELAAALAASLAPAPGPARENKNLAAALAASLVTAAVPLPSTNLVKLEKLSKNIEGLDFSIQGRDKNIEKLLPPIQIVDNETINAQAQANIQKKLEKAGFLETYGETTDPKKVFIKTDSLANGDCLFSSIYHAAIERPDVLSSLNLIFGLDDENKNEKIFIQAFRDFLASNIQQGILPSEDGKEDLYDRLKTLIKNDPKSIKTIKESFTPAFSSVIDFLSKKLNDKVGFQNEYAKFVKKQGNWMTHNEVILINQILLPLDIFVETITDLRNIPSKLSEKVRGVNVFYVYNPDEKHYIYFTFTVPEAEEASVRETLRLYLEGVRDEKLKNVRSKKSTLVSEKQKKQGEIQSLQRSRSKTPPRSGLPSHVLASLSSSPQSVRTVVPAPAPSTPLKGKKLSILSFASNSPASSVISKGSKTRYDPETGEEFKGTQKQYIERLKEVLAKEEVRSRLF